MEETSVGVADGREVDDRGEEILVEDVDVDIDAEDAENGMMMLLLLLLDEVAEDDVGKLDAACMVKDCGEGA